MSNKKIDEVLSVIGKYYGYPQCCIDYFNNRLLFERLTIEQDAVSNGKGFIPCPSCALKVYIGEIEIGSLITDRKCKKDYPDDGSMDEMQLHVLEILNGEPMVR